MFCLKFATALLLVLCIIGASHGLIKKSGNFNLDKKADKSLTTLDLVRGISKTTTSRTAPPQPPPAFHSPYNWTSVPITSIGTSDLKEAATFSYAIPDLIPSTAKEVFLYVAVWSAGEHSGPDRNLKIYTQIGTHHYENFIFLTPGYNSFNSDNMWFPMPPNRLIYLTVSAQGGITAGVYMYTIGYR